MWIWGRAYADTGKMRMIFADEIRGCNGKNAELRIFNILLVVCTLLLTFTHNFYKSIPTLTC